MLRIGVLVAVVALALGWLAWRHGRPVPLVVSGFVEADQIRVGSRVGGRVASVQVEEGKRVPAGAPLFQIEAFDLEQQLARAEAELAAARAEDARLRGGFRPEEVRQARARRDRLAAEHARLVAGPRPSEVEIAREKVNAAKASFELAKSEHQRQLDLAKTQITSELNLDRAVRTLEAARAELAANEQSLALVREGARAEEVAAAAAALAEAEANLALFEAGHHPQDIAGAAARVEAAAADVAAIKVKIAELAVRAPVDAVVEAIDLRPGDLVAANAPTVALLDLSHLWVRCYVPERHLRRAGLGSVVPVRVDGFPERRFRATVTFVAGEAEFTPRNVQTPEERSKQVFRIKLTLGEGLDVLRVGMLADVLLDEATPP